MLTLITKFIDACRGRHTAFAAFFAVSGTLFQWFGKLDAQYITFITVLQGWVFAHSFQENKFDKNATAATTPEATATPEEKS